MPRIGLITLALLVGWGAAIRADDPAKGDDEEPKLNVGDKAPTFKVKEFVKGEAVKELAKGKVHVVEFWATWCGPCKATIPHLTELQQKYADVQFIGVCVYEQKPKDVKPFVEEMGKKMDYRVATDSVPAGKDANDGAMATAWMDAAGQSGIPTAFVVNRDGVIAWIGHPSDLDQPLADIVANKWDVKAEAQRQKDERVRERKFREVAKKLEKAGDDDPKAVLAILDAAIKDDAKLEPMLAAARFEALVNLKDIEKAVAYGQRMIGELYKDNAASLNEMAWDLVDPDRDKKSDPKLVKVAVAAAKRACELTKNADSAMLDTLGCAYFLDGDVAKAIEVQEKAVKLKPDDDDLKAHLEKFKKARKDKEPK
jgi:thiol-disulfide isomerase/thioredoxin